MDLEKVEKFIFQINKLKADIERLNNRLEIITTMSKIEVLGTNSKGRQSSFDIK